MDANYEQFNLEGWQMNAVGIDVSKGKSMVCVMRPLGEVVAKPFEVCHTQTELKKLADYLKDLTGETRIVMEYTGTYYQPVARFLHDAGLYVSVVHSMLIHRYSENTIRRVKTDKKDAARIANYALDRWVGLIRYSPEEDTRQLLKTFNRQYNQYTKTKVALKNNLISLLDQTFPGINTMFTSPVRDDGRQKWIDFALKFWHCECVSEMSLTAFTTRYNNWCRKAGYNQSNAKTKSIYDYACSLTATLPKNQITERLITLAVTQLNAVMETLATVLAEMRRLASSLPEYPVVMAMQGVGDILGPQLIAEIGDVRRFQRKQSLVAFAGIDAPPFQSGAFESKSRKISKRGSPLLRKSLFLVMSVLLQKASLDDAVFQYLDKKRAEGKHFYVYMMAGANKFLRIYFARVRAFLGDTQAQPASILA